MNSLKIPLRNDQLETIGKELDRLFILQDRPFGENKKNVFVQELEALGLPFSAIISGIRALADHDIKILKLFTIKESIVKFISFEREKTNCPYCRGNGLVSMIRDNDGYSFVFACKCPAGVLTDKEFIRWNGETHQDFKGMKYKTADFVLLGNEYPKWIALLGVKGVADKSANQQCPEVQKIINVVGGQVVERINRVDWDE